MMMIGKLKLLLLLLLLVGCCIGEVSAVNVSYDHRALLLDGQRRFLISGSIHYPRSTPQMWPDLIAKAKKGGLDVIQTYVFWDVHEPTRRLYDFAGRYDLPRFVQLVHEAGLFLNLRIGPYVCAEWNSGGLPVWLRDIPGIEFRTDNEPFKAEMQRFVSVVVSLMKQHELFAQQGGPIILAQIENEYGNIDAAYGEAGKRYMRWAASMAESLDTGVPWIMCQQPDAPSFIINTCNGFYCDGWKPNAADKPTMWTENWSGWFHTWGEALPSRPVQDIAFAVARFFERGGSFQNYYMYHGGTNFGRTSDEDITTSYDYDAPLDEYGQERQPKWGHLKDLHAALKLCEPALAAVDDVPPSLRLGPNQEAHVYNSSIGLCAAFLANWDNTSAATIQFHGQAYQLPAWSVSILPDCNSVAFNTAKVRTQTVLLRMQSPSPVGRSWQSYHEPLGKWGGNIFSVHSLLEQTSTTKDFTDYLWYSTRLVNIPSLDYTSWNPALANLVSDLNQLQLSWSVTGHGTQINQTVTLMAGTNDIVFLSMTTGLQDSGAFLEQEQAGILNAVTLEGLPSGVRDLTHQLWTYQVGLEGEALHLYSANGAHTVNWPSRDNLITYQPLVWYQTLFDAPNGSNPVALNLDKMGKGQLWVNGFSLGRYWPSLISQQDNCPSTCDYRGVYTESKCLSQCSQPSQQWYHVPRQWLLPAGNSLVLFEEKGGNPETVSIATQSAHVLCSRISEFHPLDFRSFVQENSTVSDKAILRLECTTGQQIATITFASFGNPYGECGNFLKGSCHADTSYNILNKVCVGNQRCEVHVSNRLFGKDPCPGTPKSLAVEAACN
ncbi:unnamed protein product [Sphagnum compactum]